MNDSLAHRGPDDQAIYWQSPWNHEADASPPTASTAVGVALGFRRLSIIDLSTGMQPISNEDDSIQVIFNGEIYNFPDLRQRLEGNGHRFKTQGDAETIVHLYEDEGEECFRFLRGMFSIAIWDSRLKQLIVARDRLGQKPFFYAQQSGRFTFASELKAILPVHQIDTSINLNAIDQYLLYQYIPHPNTIYKGISSLPPGHSGVWKATDGSFKSSAYWQVPPARAPLAKQQAIDKLNQTLDEAVVLRMQSEVPLGAFLSGGVDSSLIAALMQKHSDQPIQTFSIGFQESEYDESKYAKLVADHLGTRHQSFLVQPDAMSILPELVHQFDQPFGDSSAIPTWYLSEMTRQQVTVALSGDGSDELFGGYHRYRAVDLAQKMDRIPGGKALFSSPLWQKIPSNMSQRNHLRRWKRFCQAMSLPPLQRYMQWIGIFHDQQRAMLYSDALLNQLGNNDPLDFLAEYYDNLHDRSPINRFSLMDLQTYLPGDLNTKVDIASMAHSLEVRQPFLDHHVVELAAQMPANWKIRSGKGKRILREAFADMIPASIWTRRKQGFGVPLDHWFRGPLKELAQQTLLGDTATRRGLFVKAEIQQMLDQHTSGKFDHAYRLWSLLVLELWFQRWKPDFKIPADL